MAIKLSGLQRKEANRPRGVSLMIRWPKHLGRPTDLNENEMRPATHPEFDAARALLDPQLKNDGIAIRRVWATIAYRPPSLPEGGTLGPHLVVDIATFRFFHAEDGPSRIMWAAD